MSTSSNSFAFGCILSILAASIAEPSVSNCNADAKGKIDDLVIAPLPVVLSKDFTKSGTIRVEKGHPPVRSLKAVVSATKNSWWGLKLTICKDGYIPIINNPACFPNICDIIGSAACDELDNTDVTEVTFAQTHKLELSGIFASIASGVYNIELKVKSADLSTEYACISISGIEVKQS